MARPEAAPKTALGSRLREVRRLLGDPDREDFAARLGVSKNTLAAYERGETEPTASILAAYVSNFRVPTDWLIFGEGDFGPSTSTMPVADEDRMVRIKHYNVSAAAGAGLVPVDEHEEQDDIILARSFLRRLGAAPDQSQVIFARGESMLPTIPDGSLLLIDRSKTHLVEGGVFVFRVGEGIKVKRARWRADQRIDLLSDNQLAGYPPETYTRDEIATIVPLGRVMCVMRVP